MKKLIKNIFKGIDIVVFKTLMKWAYPQFKNLYDGQVYYYQLFKRYFLFQKIFRINGGVPWPVDFRSQVINWKQITKDKTSYPGGSMGCYINATGGLTVGSHVIIGPNTTIATVNHSIHDYTKTSKKKGIIIGNNVWIGANCSILAGSCIGNNVTIGAGCLVNGNIPDNVIVKQSGSNTEIIEKVAKN